MRFSDQSLLDPQKSGGLGDSPFRLHADYKQSGNYPTDAHAPHPAANLCVVTSDNKPHNQEASLPVALKEGAHDSGHIPEATL